uniref:Uncharacterized protein n=1 Tax=Plectus sambesii TaxID=2011161 RepID=A0A914WXC1_9BILA
MNGRRLAVNGGALFSTKDSICDRQYRGQVFLGDRPLRRRQRAHKERTAADDVAGLAGGFRSDYGARGDLKLVSVATGQSAVPSPRRRAQCIAVACIVARFIE